MKPIKLGGFEATFAANPDPWNTFDAPDERRKRLAILHQLGPAVTGRVLELASGNGSNTAALAARALRLDATDGAPAAVALTAKAALPSRRVHVSQLILPRRFPAATYDTIVAAEILYYLTEHDLKATAREVARRLRRGGRLVLAHHHLPFADAALLPATIHARFLAALPFPVRRVRALRTARWRVETYQSRS